MNCPKCCEPMRFQEGEDEGDGDELMPYAYWLCEKCGHTIRDDEEEFEWPNNVSK
jgi:rubrerythrin